MASSASNYSKLKAFISAFPNSAETKKDLLKIKDKTLLIKYYAYREYFNIDKRLKPANTLRELKRYKADNLKFKSEELGIDLTKNSAFTDTDKYTSSSKLIAQVTKAMLGKGIKLNSISAEYREIDIRYKVTSQRKIILFDTQKDNLDFMASLKDDVYVNVGNTAYNKNGLDFDYDYHNQSNDFANNLMDYIREENLFLYRF
jgi:hypothetical protein